MQHERIWQPEQAASSENVGDVLASIRRLIAQDQAKLPCGRTVVESQPCASAQTLTPEMRPPFVLGRSDMVAPQMPQPPALDRDAPRLHLASVSTAAIAPAQERTTAWRPSPIPDWPTIHPRQDLPTPEMAAAKPAAPLDGGISPEDEAEFAEAEAALARMTAPRPLAAAQQTTTAAPDQDAAAFKETQMAQDMRMMEMGRIDDISAIRPVPTAEGLGFGAPQGDARTAPNLFGEIGGMAKDATLRMLIRDAIQTELHGELGARLSRNMCQMIRQEVEAVIREICAES